MLQRQEKSPCSRRNRGFLGDGLLDDAGSEAGDNLFTSFSGGRSHCKITEDDVSCAGGYFVGSIDYTGAVVDVSRGESLFRHDGEIILASLGVAAVDLQPFYRLKSRWVVRRVLRRPREHIDIVRFIVLGRHPSTSLVDGFAVCPLFFPDLCGKGRIERSDQRIVDGFRV